MLYFSSKAVLAKFEPYLGGTLKKIITNKMMVKLSPDYTD